ncbi:hypothetical protein GCM10027068_50480 [Prescottella soli]
MGAALGDPPVVEDHDLIGVPDRREAVRDRDRGPAAADDVERVLHRPLGLVVERAGGLVEHQDPRVPQQGSRDRDALLLAAGEPVPARADDGVVAVGQRRDQLVHLRGAGRRFDLGVGRLRSGVPQVLADRRVQQVRLLRDHADQLGQLREPDVAQVHTVDGHRTRRRVVQAGDERCQRGLAGTGFTDQRERRSGGDVDRDVGQRVPVGILVPEADVFETHRTVGPFTRHGNRAFGVVDLHRQVQILEDPAEQCQRTRHGHTDVQQLHQRPEKGTLQSGERDQRADRHAPGGSGQAGSEVEQRGDGREHDAHRRHPPATRQLGADFEVGEHQRRVRKALRHRGTRTERLAELDAADRE